MHTYVIQDIVPFSENFSTIVIVTSESSWDPLGFSTLKCYLRKLSGAWNVIAFKKSGELYVITMLDLKTTVVDQIEFRDHSFFDGRPCDHHLVFIGNYLLSCLRDLGTQLRFSVTNSIFFRIMWLSGLLFLRVLYNLRRLTGHIINCLEVRSHLVCHVLRDYIDSRFINKRLTEKTILLRKLLTHLGSLDSGLLRK